MNYPNRLIKEGEKDVEIVKAIQQRLNQIGYGSFEGTGIFGPKTTSAVKQFQSQHRDPQGVPLTPDGKIGAITWQILFGTKSVPVVDKAEKGISAEAVKVAKTQIGVMESPPNSNKGPEVNQYLASVNCPPGNFWCAGFVYWCFNEAAKKLKRDNPACKTAGCLFHWNNSSGKKITTREAINNPSLIKPGAVFIMDHGKGMGHTGIISRVEGGFIYTIEGNSNSGGSRNGIGVFELTRKIASINKGFIEYI